MIPAEELPPPPTSCGACHGTDIYWNRQAKEWRCRQCCPDPEGPPDQVKVIYPRPKVEFEIII